MYHKDSHKMRGISPSLALDIVRTSPFRNRGCTDDTARKVVRDMVISRKNKISSRGSSTGKAALGTPNCPGKLWMSIFVGERPAKVAALFLHEMIHSALGIRHTDEFNRVLSEAAEELWGVRIKRSGYSHVYESDHALDKALFRSGRFDNIVPAESIHPKCRAVAKTFHKKVRTTAKCEFQRGDSVKFTHKGETLNGIITRVNKRRFSVNVPGDYRRWLVPGKMLSRN